MDKDKLEKTKEELLNEEIKALRAEVFGLKLIIRMNMGLDDEQIEDFFKEYGK